jgi:hypothetical protein
MTDSLLVQSTPSPDDKYKVLEMENVESLRQILENEQSRPVTYEEALEVGRSLINFFEALGGDPPQDTLGTPCVSS